MRRRDGISPPRASSTSETRITARVEYACAGTLRLAPATGTDLYRLVMPYDAERYTPLSAFDAGNARCV